MIAPPSGAPTLNDYDPPDVIVGGRTCPPLVNRYTPLIFGVIATYDAAYAQYEAERDENLLVDLYEIPDSKVTINMNDAHRIERPAR